MTLPKYLYHYTSQKGLLGILKDKKLWMTNILYLNDSSEFTHTLDLVKPEFTKRKNQLPPRNQLLESIEYDEKKLSVDNKISITYKNILNYFEDLPYNSIIESYVFSLSENKDDLNQWRGYCHQGGGFCVEFDTKKLLPIIKKTKKEYKIKKCIYDPKDKKFLVEDLFDLIQTLFVSDKNLKIFNVSVEIFVKIINLSSYIKDYSFSDEKEYRIIFQGPHDDIHNRKRYREGKSMIIPYVEFEPIDNDGQLPISKIIVGPTPHKLSILSIKHLLKSLDYDIEVEPSNIPYRPLSTDYRNDSR